jgi:hypothetical protein
MRFSGYYFLAFVLTFAVWFSWPYGKIEGLNFYSSETIQILPLGKSLPLSSGSSKDSFRFTFKGFSPFHDSANVNLLSSLAPVAFFFYLTLYKLLRFVSHYLII